MSGLSRPMRRDEGERVQLRNRQLRQHPQLKAGWRPADLARYPDWSNRALIGQRIPFPAARIRRPFGLPVVY